MFEHAQLGLVSFPLKQLKRLQLYDGGSTSSVALLIIEYDDDIAQCLPVWIQEYNTLLLSVMPYTSTHRTFYKQFLPRLRSRELKGPSLEDLKDLQSEYQDIYTQLCFHQSVVAAGSSAKAMDKAQDRFPNLMRFISHLRASRSLEATIVSDNDLSALIFQPPTTSTTTNNDFLMSPLMHCPVTILTGVPGSGKDQLTQSIVSWDKESTKWVVLRQPFDSCENFDIESFQSSLSTVVDRMSRKLSSSMRKTRVLVITPGLTDVREVVWSILSYPEKSVKETLWIGSITACVDLQNCCSDSGFLFPNLLENCAVGVVNNIVWTGQKSDDQSYIEQLIRTGNPAASFINSQPGHTLREEDMDLILSTDLFSNTACLQDRLLFHGKFLSCPHPGTKPDKDFSMVCLKFCQFLDKKQLASQLTLLKSVTKDVRQGAQPIVYHIRARVAFTDSSGLSELEFVRQSGHLSLSPLDEGQTKRASRSNSQHSMPTCQFESCFVFFGTHLSEAWLKIWLRGCQPQEQLKKLHRTRKDLLKAEIEQIHSAHKHDPLPPGVFYNGFHYVNMDGEKTEKHPMLDQFIDEFLKAENEKIDQHNREIVQDMFD
jgi:G3E family GTPase